MSKDKKYIHEVHSNDKVPEVDIYEVMDNDDDNCRVLIGDIEKFRSFMKGRTGMGREDDEMTPKQLDDDDTLFKYADFWGYTANIVFTVKLKDFK